MRVPHLRHHLNDLSMDAIIADKQHGITMVFQRIGRGPFKGSWNMELKFIQRLSPSVTVTTSPIETLLTRN